MVYGKIRVLGFNEVAHELRKSFVSFVGSDIPTAREPFVKYGVAFNLNILEGLVRAWEDNMKNVRAARR